MEYHVHRGNDVWQAFLLLAVEGALLQCLAVRRAFYLLLHVVERLAEETCRTTGWIHHRLADVWVHHLHDGTDKRARSVIFAAVASGVAHALNLALVEHCHLMLVVSRLEVERVYLVYYLTKVVAALNLVAQLGENLANLIFQRTYFRRRVLEP